MIYEWKPGTRHKVKADVAAAECKRLEADGRLTAKVLVDESRPEDAPLHSEFEWDDTVAADKFREHQARNIINAIVIVSEERKPVRQFFNLDVSRSEYMSLDVILKKKETATALLDMAIRDLKVFQTKYGTLEELVALNFEIDKTVKMYEKVG